MKIEKNSIRFPFFFAENISHTITEIIANIMGRFPLIFLSFESNFVSRITHTYTHTNKQSTPIGSMPFNVFFIRFVFVEWIDDGNLLSHLLSVLLSIKRNHSNVISHQPLTSIQIYAIQLSASNSDPNWNAHFINRKKNIFFKK